MSANRTCASAIGSAAATVQLHLSDLNGNGSVACPNPLAQLQGWSGHPKVYLDVASTGAAVCPYCGTRYSLAAGVAAHSRH